MREDKFDKIIHEVEHLFNRLKKSVGGVVESESLDDDSSGCNTIICKCGGYTYSQTNYNDRKKIRNSFKLCGSPMLEIVVEDGLVDSFKYDAGLFKEMQKFVAKSESKKCLKDGN